MGNTLPYPQDLPDDEYPIFCTWLIDGKLNGCIGTFGKGKLSEVVPEYSYISAFEDSRFTPLSMEVFPKLSCYLSLLKDFENFSDPYDFEIGKHGVWVVFEVGDEERHSSTYIPNVPKDQGWDHDNTWRHLIKKAGLGTTPLEDLVSNIVILKRYQSTKFGMTYEEYLKFKEEGSTE